MAWIKRKKTAARYDVVPRTIERWEADPKLNFPRSMIRNGRRYDDEAQLDAWDAKCAANGRAARSPNPDRAERPSPKLLAADV
jgi:hypothetical protein